MIMKSSFRPEEAGRYDLRGSYQPVLPIELLHLTRAVLGIRDLALSCDECEGWLPSYVQDEVSGLAVGRIYPLVKRHLDLCIGCAERYLEMLALAMLEEGGKWPTIEHIPAPDLSFLPPLDDD